MITHEYSPEHVRAFKRWRQVGSDQITDAELTAIEREDRATGAHIRRERAGTIAKDLERFRQSQPQPAPRPTASAMATTWPDDAEIDTDEKLKGWLAGHCKQAASAGFVVQAITGFVRRTGLFEFTAETKKRVQALEQRIQQLEDRPAPMNYRGVYREADGPYLPNEVVTHAGSGWVCKEMTSAKPGGPNVESRAWQLFVKKGDDAPREPR